MPIPKEKKKSVKGAPAKEYAAAPKTTKRKLTKQTAARAQAGTYSG